MSRRVLLLLSACIAAPTPLPGQQPSPAGRDSVVVVLLGTGMPRPDPDASGPATAVVVGRRVFLVDAGPGIERRLAAAHLPIDGVTALFITHLHSDHTLGYPDLIFTSWVMGRKQPLAAYGPHGLQKMTDHLVAAWAEDIEVRVWDSTAELRYLVLPERPAGTERLSEEALAALVTRDAMIGVAKVLPPQSGRQA